MEMNKESTIELGNAITDMARNSFVDEMISSVLVVFVRCNDCDCFHLHTYTVGEMLDSMGVADVLGMMMFGDGEMDGGAVVKTASKNIGAQLASTNKEVLAVAMIAAGGKAKINESIASSLSDDEIKDLIMKVVGGENDDRVEIEPSMSVVTYGVPDSYYSINYKIEIVGNDDVLLADREENNERGEGDMFAIHESLVRSASFLSNVTSASKPIKSCAPQPEAETVLSGDNEAKFRMIVNRIESSLKVEDVV